MRNLEFVKGIFEQCKRDLDSLGIPYGSVRNFEVKHLEIYVYGCTRRFENSSTGKSRYDIYITDLYLDSRTDVNGLRGVIYHELCHTVDGCCEHNDKWTFIAKSVAAAFPECPVCDAGVKDHGIPDEVYWETYWGGKPKYAAKCCKCNNIFYYKRMNKLLKNIDKANCSCGGIGTLNLLKFEKGEWVKVKL